MRLTKSLYTRSIRMMPERPPRATETDVVRGLPFRILPLRPPLVVLSKRRAGGWRSRQPQDSRSINEFRHKPQGFFALSPLPLAPAPALPIPILSVGVPRIPRRRKGRGEQKARAGARGRETGHGRRVYRPGGFPRRLSCCCRHLWRRSERKPSRRSFCSGVRMLRRLCIMSDRI